MLSRSCWLTKSKIQPISEIQDMEEKLSNELSNEIQKKIRELQEKNNTEEFKYGQE